MSEAINLNSLRAKRARLGNRIGHTGYIALLIIIGVCIIASGWLIYKKTFHYMYFSAALALLSYMLAVWYKRDLSVLPPEGQDINSRLSVDILTRLKPRQQLTPRSVWTSISNHWQAVFFSNHLLLPLGMIESYMSDNPDDLEVSLKRADELAKDNQTQIIELGLLAAGLMASSDGVKEFLTRAKLQESDIPELAGWLSRITSTRDKTKQSFGGVGRDWAFGFTPMLDHFGQNISLAIQKYGANFGWLTTSGSVRAIEATLVSSSNVVAVVGPPGIGKTSHVYALAQRLIEGVSDKALAYNQIVSLDAANILTNAQNPGDLEHLINQLASEAAHAGHIILYLENSILFFGDGPGSFNASNILLPIFQSRRTKVIMTFTPDDFQRLKNKANVLAGLVTPIVLSEQPEANVMHILEDTAINLEGKYRVLVTYESIREAYRLSGRYNQDEAYPGKAIKLLEQSISNAKNKVLTAGSIAETVEQTSGVKVSSAGPAEADVLLHLEDRIHRRMVNQSHAVSVVSAALRRSRAGVSDPNRPIGSFLFLGPTGVGKTELAKSLAAEYFGSESNIVRLDMSEYQQSSDVQILLDSGQTESSSLIMGIRRQPFSVVLLDEVEKAHPNILNLLLQLLDEGKITDSNGKPASFKDAIIIATSNAGAQEIRDRVQAGESLESFEDSFSDHLISSGQFKPELLNRFDNIVIFRPLKPDELNKIVRLMLAQVNKTLSNQNISVDLTDGAVAAIVEAGYDPRLGARPMRRVLQRAVEDSVAKRILEKQVGPGDHIVLDKPDLDID